MKNVDPHAMFWAAARRWIVILFVFVATLELAARIDDALTWGAPLLGPYSHARLVVSDSLGFRNRPGYRFEKWSINSDGFRGPEVYSVPASGGLRVGVLGASETFGLFEREGWDYPSRLRAVVDSLGPGGIEVVNLGVAGMGLPAMAAYYERVVKKISPDLIIIYPSPSFYLDIDPPTKPGVAQETMAADTDPTPSARTVNGGLHFFPESRLRWKVRSVLKQFIPPELQEASHRRRIEGIRRGHDPEWVWETVPPERVRLFQAHLEELIGAVTRDGTALILMTHVNRFMKSEDAFTSEDRRHMTAILSQFPRATPAVMSGVDMAANQVVREVARERDLTLVDVVGQIPAEATYFADYAHFTDAGADLMARILAGPVIRFANGLSHR